MEGETAGQCASFCQFDVTYMDNLSLTRTGGTKMRISLYWPILKIEDKTRRLARRRYPGFPTPGHDFRDRSLL